MLKFKILEYLKNKDEIRRYTSDVYAMEEYNVRTIREMVEIIINKKDEIKDSILDIDLVVEVYVNKYNLKAIMEAMSFFAMEPGIRVSFAEAK